MEKAIIVRGMVADPRRVDLDEPVTEMIGPVEVVLRPAAPLSRPAQDIFDLIAALPAGERSKADIDRQIAEEHAAWGGAYGFTPCSASQRG